jgi:hypothetical protein
MGKKTKRGKMFDVHTMWSFVAAAALQKLA